LSKLPTDFYLRPALWHLHNQGQDGKPGIDINVLPVWEDYTGEGVKVVVFDTGVDATHPDLVGNFLPDYAYNFSTNSPGANYLDQANPHPHGTFVSGLIAATGAKVGLLGVAFGSKFSAYADFNGPESRSAFARAADEGFDVMNNSWGTDLPFQSTFHHQPKGLASMTYAVQHGRDGLGLNIVFAAGNAYSLVRVLEPLGYKWSGEFPMADANGSSYQNSRFVITVGALDRDGTYAAGEDALGYSTPGAPVLVSAPGTGVVSTNVSGPHGYGDQLYAEASGTSFAAPVVSGVIALMLEANPFLGYRDVKEILAYSALLNDLEDPSWKVNGASNHNGGGLLNNDNYGYGMVDATGAVRLAETWHKQSVFENEMMVNASDRTQTQIVDGGIIEYKFELSEGVNVETIELDFHITHAEFGDLVIELISPDGTSSMLLYRPTDGRATELTRALYEASGGAIDESRLTNITHTLTSNDFFGESSAGTWTLRIADQKLGNTGVVHNLELRAYGSEASPDQTYIYTNDFALAAEMDASRTTLSNSTGTHALNLAAVTDAVTVDLSAGKAKITGTELTIAADTKINSVFTGDGADLVTLSPAGGKAVLGRGNDTASALKGEVDGGRGFDRLMLADALDQYRIIASDGAVSLSHKNSGDVLQANLVEFFTFGTNAADILILTTSAVEAQLARLYDLVLGRAADFEGLAYWTQRAEEGASLGAIASSFSASDEFATIGQTQSPDDFIDLLYTHMLRRDADTDGASYWAGRLADGVDRHEIAVSFALSNEAAALEIAHVRLLGTGSEILFA
jgi:subtilisin-like proprotein convertase family protein